MNLLRFHQVSELAPEPIAYDLYDEDGNYLGSSAELEQYKRCQVKVVQLDYIDGLPFHHCQIQTGGNYENAKH